MNRVQFKVIRHSGSRYRPVNTIPLRLGFGNKFRRCPLIVTCFIDPCKTRMVTLVVRLVSPADSVTCIQGLKGKNFVLYGRKPDTQEDCAQRDASQAWRQDGGFWRLGHAGRISFKRRVSKGAPGGAHRRWDV